MRMPFHGKSNEAGGGKRCRGASSRLARAAILVVVSALLFACAEPLPRKRSFIGQGRGVRENVAEPAGLNPLGALETCARDARDSPEGERVLVSRPEYFTEDASRMIVALREALAQNNEAREVIELQLSHGPIRSMEEATREGRRCGALIVLWEQRESQTLELTLPTPARVPLRSQVQENLCEFGDRSEQATILYFTIVGLTAMVKNDYDLAQFYLNAANRVDVDCLRIPLANQPHPGRSFKLTQ